MKLRDIISTFTGMLLAATATVSNAQSTDILQHQITWTSSADKDMISGEVFQKTMTFITSTSKVEMKVRESVQPFLITSVEGSWPDITQQGTIIYHVTLYGDAGLITIKKNSSGTFLTLDMRTSSPDGIYRTFTIDSFSVNN